MSFQAETFINPNESVDFSDPDSIAAYAKKLEGMTFRDLLERGIASENSKRDYNNKRYKGGMGTLIEEKFFGYQANSNREADFAQAGVELKTTCYDVKKNGECSAGERLVLTMIPFNEPVPDDFYESHVWSKSEKILLVYYERNKDIDKYDQVIKYTALYTPPKEDLKIIEDDYKKIASIIKDGKAEELSESLTTYLGACTKGATAKSSLVNQYYPPHNKAKKRAFCFKRQYMDYILHKYLMHEDEPSEKIITDAESLQEVTFEEYVLNKINQHVGKTDKQLCRMLDIEYTGNKAQWTKISYALLGIRGDKAEEFEKANISVRTVRIRENGHVAEAMSLGNIDFLKLSEEKWDDSSLHEYFEETRFLFVTFKEEKGERTLVGAKFWSMPKGDIEGPLYKCWQQTQHIVNEGVQFTINSNGSVSNNLPGIAENPVAHVRPHSAKSWYRFKNGLTKGEKPAYGSPLPDGQEITKQSFWLNSSYIERIVS